MKQLHVRKIRCGYKFCIDIQCGTYDYRARDKIIKTAKDHGPMRIKVHNGYIRIRCSRNLVVVLSLIFPNSSTRELIVDK